MKCALEIEDARAFWAHPPADTAGAALTPRAAFDAYLFGARSLPRIEVLLANMRARFSSFPSALHALHAWPHMEPDTRRVICHWHLQLADPLYRGFTGTWLVSRRGRLRREVTRELVIAWVTEHGAAHWTLASRVQFASKLLSAAYSAGLVSSNRDPRPLSLPRVPDLALAYFLYVLRETEFTGTLLDNPYFRSVGLEGGVLEDRLRALPSALDFRRHGDLIDFGWRHADLTAWAAATLTPSRGD